MCATDSRAAVLRNTRDSANCYADIEFVVAYAERKRSERALPRNFAQRQHAIDECIMVGEVKNARVLSACGARSGCSAICRLKALLVDANVVDTIRLGQR